MLNSNPMKPSFVARPCWVKSWGKRPQEPCNGLANRLVLTFNGKSSHWAQVCRCGAWFYIAEVQDADFTQNV